MPIATDWRQSLAIGASLAACYAARSEIKECIMAKGNDRSFADILAETVGKAITDIRQHVVEEPWFGQVLREFPARDIEHGQTVGQEIGIEHDDL
jgi:hypothetical protein